MCLFTSYHLFSVNGGTSYFTTDSGSIEFYPQTDNAQDFSHVWDITTSPDTAIALYFEDFLTEACCDVLTVSSKTTISSTQRICLSMELEAICISSRGEDWKECPKDVGCPLNFADLWCGSFSLMKIGMKSSAFTNFNRMQELSCHSHRLLLILPLFSDQFPFSFLCKWS